MSVIAFFLGVAMTNSGKQTVTKEVPIEKIVEVEKNADVWHDLKDVDDQGFAIAGEQMSLCSDGFRAVANSDINEMTRVTTEVKARTAVMNALATKRQSLLQKLGY